MRSLAPEDATNELMTKHALAEGAARNLLQYLRDQAASTHAVPDATTTTAAVCRPFVPGSSRATLIGPAAATPRMSCALDPRDTSAAGRSAAK